MRIVNGLLLMAAGLIVVPLMAFDDWLRERERRRVAREKIEAERGS